MTATIIMPNFEEPKEVKSFLKQILDYLPQLPREWEVPKNFTNGEYDSQQTRYEKMANRLKIAVSASSKTEGYILLYFLRVIIDNHSAEDVGVRFCDMFEDENSDKWETGKVVKISDVCDLLSGLETSYSAIFDSDQPMTAELGGGKYVGPDEQGPQSRVTKTKVITVEKGNPEFDYGGESWCRITTKITKRPDQVNMWDCRSIRVALLTLLK